MACDAIEAVEATIDEGIDGLNEMLQEDSDDDFPLSMMGDVAIEVACLVFPRLDRSFLQAMMRRCDYLGAASRGLLRTLVGFPDLRKLDEGQENELEPSIALFAACGTGDVELAELLLQRDDVRLLWENCDLWDAAKRTTSMHAAACGNFEVMRCIIDNTPASEDMQFDADSNLIACAMADVLEYASRLLDEGAWPIYIDQLLQNDCRGKLQSTYRNNCVP